MYGFLALQPKAGHGSFGRSFNTLCGCRNPLSKEQLRRLHQRTLIDPYSKPYRPLLKELYKGTPVPTINDLWLQFQVAGFGLNSGARDPM